MPKIESAFALVILFTLPGCGSGPVDSPIEGSSPSPSSGSSVQTSTLSTPQFDALPAAGIAAVGREPLALYWMDRKDKSVWRSSLDGSRKELVVDLSGTSAGSGVRLNTSWTSKGSLLSVGSVPNHGYTVLEPLSRIEKIREWEQKQLQLAVGNTKLSVPFTYGSSSSPWSAQITVKYIPEADHAHPGITRIELSKPASSAITYDFTGPDGVLLCLMPSEAAVVRDGNQFILWTLFDDKRYLLATSEMAFIWPRDLAKAKRAKPVARVSSDGSVYSYEWESPTDMNRKLSDMKFVRQMRR